MRLGSETVLVNLLHLDVGPGTRAVVIGWDERIVIQDMSEAQSHAKFLSDRNFRLPDPTKKVGHRSVWAVGTVVATQAAAAPDKGARAPRADLAEIEVCGRA